MTSADPKVRRALTTMVVAALALSLLALAPPAPASADVLSTDFSGTTPGQPPAGWTSRWEPAWFVAGADPARLIQAPTQGADQLISYDAAGIVSGDVEIATLVQVPAMNFASTRSGTAFTLHLNASGAADSETSYVLDQRGDELSIGKLVGGDDENVDLAEAPLPDGWDRYVWYHVVFGREGDTLRAKAWAAGTPEPEAWTVEYTDPDPLPAEGMVGVGSHNQSTNPGYSDFAWFAVGTGADDAPRAPEGLVTQAPVPTAPVGGVAVEQEYGFTTVSWDADASVPDLLTEYHVYRVPVDDSNTPTGEEQLVGVWRPQRYTYTGDSKTFADAGFVPGGRFGWSVSAVTAAGEGPRSAWVYDTTVAPPSPGPEWRTAFENNMAAGVNEWTTYEEELAFTSAVANSSDRAHVQVVGTSHLGRSIFLWSFGEPPPTTPEENDKPVVLLNCLVHGPEAAGREACFMLIRELAFSDDPWVADVLEEMTVLIVPAINVDGRAVPQRGNAHDNQDLNRDHSLLREPETLALAKVISAWEPQLAIDGHHYGSNDVGDLPLLWGRNHMIDEDLAAFTQNDLTLGHLFTNAEEDGWWPQPYPIGYSEETILRNTLGLKNIVGVLLESRSSGGATRPSEQDNPIANKQRHVYSHLWTYRQMLDYHLENHEEIAAVVAEAKADQAANEGALVLDGARDTPRFSPPPRPTTPTAIIEEPPCGYLISPDQYTEQVDYGEDYPQFGLMPSPADRLEAHGIEVYEVRARGRDTQSGYFVPLAQPLRGLVALLLDPNAAGQDDLPGSYQGPFLFSGDAERLEDCPRGIVRPRPERPVVIRPERPIRPRVGVGG